MRNLVSLVVIALLISCTSSVPTEVNHAKLEELNNALKEDRIADVHAVLVDYRGDRIFEGYYEAPDEDWGSPLGKVKHTPDRKHDLRSVSKSVTTLLLGMALGDDWNADLERTLGSFFPERSSDMGEGIEFVTLENMLTMQAGIEWNEMTEPYADAEGNYSLINDENRLYDTDDPLSLVLTRKVVTKPGASGTTTVD